MDSVAQQVFKNLFDEVRSQYRCKEKAYHKYEDFIVYFVLNDPRVDWQNPGSSIGTLLRRFFERVKLDSNHDNPIEKYFEDNPIDESWYRILGEYGIQKRAQSSAFLGEQKRCFKNESEESSRASVKGMMAAHLCSQYDFNNLENG